MQSKKTSDGDKPIGSEASTQPLAAPEPIPAIVPPAPAPAAKAEEKPAPEKRTPAEWAVKHKLTKERDPRLPQSTDWVHPSHAAADELYGWSKHAYNFQAPEDRFAITEADYIAALRSAVQYPATELTQGAITPTAAPKFVGFVPKRNLKLEALEAERAARKKAKAEADAKAKKEPSR